MANYANTKSIIAQNIYTNHEGKVTAEMVKTAANEIVNTLIAGGYFYAGIAKLTPTQTNPGSPDANVFYIATEPGTYTNFVGAGGSLVVADGEVAIFKWNGVWTKETTGAATAAQVNELGQEVYDKEFLSCIALTQAQVKSLARVPRCIIALGVVPSYNPDEQLYIKYCGKKNGQSEATFRVADGNGASIDSITIALTQQYGIAVAQGTYFTFLIDIRSLYRFDDYTGAGNYYNYGTTLPIDLAATKNTELSRIIANYGTLNTSINNVDEKVELIKPVITTGCFSFLRNLEGKTITQDDLEQGGMAFGKKIASAKRLRTKYWFPVKEGDKVIYESGNVRMGIILIETPESTSYTEAALWIAAENSGEYTFHHDGFCALLFAKTDDSDLIVSDFSRSVIIKNMTFDSLLDNTNRILDYEVNYDFEEKVFPVFEIGGWGPSGHSVKNERVRTHDRIHVLSKLYVFGYDYATFKSAVFFYTLSGSTFTYQSYLIQGDKDYTGGIEYSLPTALEGRTDVYAGVCLIKRSGANVTQQELVKCQKEVRLGYTPQRITGKNRLRYQFGGLGNNWCFVRTPDNYDANRPQPYPFVICNHGNGWTMDDTPQKMNWTKRTMYVPLTDPDYINNPDQYNGTDNELLWYSNPTIEALLAAGFVVCGCENYGDGLYGNENCRKACAQFFEHIQEYYNVEKRCCMIGASNGAQTSINAAYLLGEKVKAMILQYPLSCLVNQYFAHPEHQAGIRAAYGITDPDIDESGLISATRTHDSLHTNTIDGKRAAYFPPTKLYYSLGDAVTPASANALALFAYLDGSLKIVDKKECTGEHGNASHFNPAEYVEFFNLY